MNAVYLNYKSFKPPLKRRRPVGLGGNAHTRIIQHHHGYLMVNTAPCLIFYRSPLLQQPTGHR